MIFAALPGDACRTYLIASERTREAVLVDPVLPRLDELLAELKRRELSLRWVVDTHTHADHLSAGAALRERLGAGYLMHRSSPATRVERRVEDGETLGLGELALTFAHVPGHTRDSLMVVLPDRLLSGDFLFLGEDGAGRLDLPGGDVASHYESLRRLDAFAGGTLVFPGHDYRGRASSTLEAERAANPVLRPRPREEYLRWQESLKRTPEEWMRAVVAANASGATDPQAAPIPRENHTCSACPAPDAEVVECTAQELAHRLKSGGLCLLDVREPDEYVGELGHIAGSRLLPVGELSSRLAEVPKGPVVTVCRSGKRSARAAQELMKAGRNDVVSLAGGMLAWNAAGLAVERR